MVSGKEVKGFAKLKTNDAIVPRALDEILDDLAVLSAANYNVRAFCSQRNVIGAFQSNKPLTGKPST